MSGLSTLWSVSLAIAAAALLTMIGLLLARLLSGWTTSERDSQRRQLVPMLLGAVPAGKISWLGRRSLLTDLSVELIRLVRGSDRDRFVATATRLGVPARLRHKLGSGSTRVRLSALEALAEFGDERSLDSLHLALRDRNSDIRLSAALALAATGQAPPARDLVRMLGIGTTEHSLLTNALLREIARYRPEEVRALIEDDDIPSGAKASAIQALALTGDYSLVPLVATLAVEAAPEDPALPRYLVALGGLGHPTARAAIQHCLSSGVGEVRAAAAEAAGRIGLVKLAPMLAQGLGDDVFWVRFRCGEALSRLGETGSAMLRETASAAHEPARTAAAVTIAERGLA